jgi:heat shock protein HspQ
VRGDPGLWPEHEEDPRRQIQDRPGGAPPAVSVPRRRVRHDPEFDNTEEWYQSIPAEVRPRKDQPFYHLFAENAETEYIAYVSEQNLLPDTSGEPVRHPQVAEVFERDEKGSYRPRNSLLN